MKYLVTLLLALSSLFSLGAAHGADFLEVEQAFKLQAELKDAKTLSLGWAIAPGYKLYRDRVKLGVEGAQAQLADAPLPRGEVKFDVNLNKEVETFHKRLDLPVAIAKAQAPFVLTLSYQGCAEEGLCYPPVDLRFAVDPAKPGLLTALAEDEAGPAAIDAATASASASATVTAARSATVAVEQDDSSLAQQTLKSGSLWRIGGGFFIFGLLLSFTPCVLPMIPILSSIIVGEGNVSRGRGFMLALAYCLGMALIYSAMGIGAGLAGASMAAALQTPWVLGMFASLLVVLSLSMFDVYQLQMPSSLQSRLSNTSGSLRGGRFIGVFVMGALSAMIVGPCVAAPLAGALLYISQTGNVFTGGWALFAMAMGMSVPLLLTGVSAGSLLPRAGGWMNGVKRVFGLLLIATAIWMVSPVLPASVLMLLVGAYAILCAVHLHVFDAAHLHTKTGVTGQRFGKTLGLVFLLLGVFELLGAVSGGNNVMQPLEHLRGGAGGSLQAEAKPASRFKRISNLQDLERELAGATAPVMLDFYADWCVACKEMEHLTFSDKTVAETMGKYTLLQIDVTANNDADKAMMKKFSLFGPPAIVFFDKDGKENAPARVMGYMAKEAFLPRIQGHLGS
ncbi:protein-disulfide reductase DsbD [Pseudoduganella sp. LjRoot289]|uniref:protein-disulfide reductase DsbD n=1 Tax=Pseudoduganella sp. LjRoot289 TaxID=3342314 RepID=UPI003ECCB251